MQRRDPLVLLVEDNEDDEALTLRGFNKHLPGARVIVARDGQQAISMISGIESGNQGTAQADVPDFVLLDLKLPLASGFEVMHRLRSVEATRKIPVVVFSSSDQPQDVANSYLHGANTFVQKPTQYEDYMPVIGAIAHYWFEVASLPVEAN